LQVSYIKGATEKAAESQHKTEVCIRVLLDKTGKKQICYKIATDRIQQRLTTDPHVSITVMHKHSLHSVDSYMHFKAHLLD